MSYLEELLPEFRKGAKIRMKDWPKPFYYEMRNRKVYNQDGHRVKNFSHQALFKNVWEFYKDPDPDWQYIIKNKCLCWFWDDDESEKIVGILINVEKDEYTPFLLYGEYYFEHCRPVRRDEVTFYEDKKDE
jgi:hypothetical protein